VAAKAPNQPDPKALYSNEVVTLGVLHQTHSKSSTLEYTVCLISLCIVAY